MSYEVILRYGDETAEVPSHSEGGIFVQNGTNLACISITYNYSVFFNEHLGDDGIRGLNGKPARETINKLEKAVSALSSFLPDNNYWKPTAGNAGRALSILLNWAKLHPNAVWKVMF